MHSSCLLCCGLQSSAARQSEPLANLDRFLALGILSFQIDSEAANHLCSHHHEDCIWHNVPAPSLLRSILRLDEVAAVADMVDFLVKNQFVAITGRLVQSRVLLFRVYIIPYDLPNVQGRLRLREDFVLTTARQYMRVVLSRVLCSSMLWDGNLDGVHEYRRHSLIEVVVSRSALPIQ